MALLRDFLYDYMIKEVIFFCGGDSSKAQTWSNVPYLFTKELINRGIVVRRVDLLGYGLSFISRCYNLFISRLVRLLYPNNMGAYSFGRTSLYRFFVDMIIRRAVRRYSHADYCIFIGYDFYNKYSKIPTLLFGDWTYKILVAERLKRSIYWFERRFVRQQDEAILHAKHVVSLFPVCAYHMRKDYPTVDISYLGGNVINSFYEGCLQENEVIARKTKSNRILFIGGKKYREGAQMLIETFMMSCMKNDYELHIIGMNDQDLSGIPPNVYCHGYLKKDVKHDADIYYDLLLSAKVIVNPTPLWGGYSSVIEAMYFYTPVIVSPYDDFVNEFGNEIDFGIYNIDNSCSSLASAIERLCLSDHYVSMCVAAHDRVKDYTWKNYINKLLNLIDKDNESEA